MTTNNSNRLLIIMIAIFTGLSFNLYSQHNSVTGFASAGISDIQVRGLGLLDLVDPYIKPIAQYTAGVQYERDFNNHLSFITGAQFTSRGFSAKETFNVDIGIIDLPVNASLETRLHYIEVPAMMKYSIGEGSVQPYVKAGASTAYAMSAKIQPKVNAIISWNLPAINVNLENDMYNRLDVSAIAGAGLNIPVGSTASVMLDVTYRHSLNDMFLDKITDIRIKSHGLAAGIGYTMRF